jgi:hypothetical protein
MTRKTRTFAPNRIKDRNPYVKRASAYTNLYNVLPTNLLEFNQT